MAVGNINKTTPSNNYLTNKTAKSRHRYHMDKLFTFWRKYVSISTASEVFVRQHAKIHRYKKNSFFARYYEVKPYWCFIVEGLAAGCMTEEDGKKRIIWLVTPPDYFTGTKHNYSNHGENLDIRFLVNSKIIAIRQEQMRYAQQHLADVGELMQVLKQRKLNQQHQLLEISKITNDIDKYVAFRTAFPELGALLTNRQVSQFLNIHEKSCTRGKLKYIERYKKTPG